MNAVIRMLEASFEERLDYHCKCVEEGLEIEARKASNQAAAYLEAIEVLKTYKLLSE